VVTEPGQIGFAGVANWQFCFCGFIAQQTALYVF